MTHLVEIFFQWVLPAVVTVMGGIMIARMNRIDRQVSNDHSTSDSPANLRVQMDQIQTAGKQTNALVASIEQGHREYRAENDEVIRKMSDAITAIHATQQSNLDMLTRSLDGLAEADRQLAQRIDNILVRTLPRYTAGE